MNSLAPQFGDPFVGVTVMDASDYEARCDRYKKLLTAAQNVIRRLEWEAEMDRTTIDDLQQQLSFVRANAPRSAPRLTDSPTCCRSYGPAAVNIDGTFA
jgi:hypothetical protein